MPALLELREVEKSFGGTPVLRRLSLAAEEGEVLVLLGASGSGKTTLLRVIAGFESPDAGRLILGGEEITALPPARRRFGMVFQHYALFPHLSVAENVAFGLERHGLDREERARRVAEALALVDLDGFEERRVQEISGGQQQRVAVARALAPEPTVLLLDEPLSNLDPELRDRTRRELREAIERVGITALWVTHEQQEAFDVGDRVAILEAGRLAQVGSPETLYQEPASRFVAGFVGRASFLPAVAADGGTAILGDERFVGGGARWPAAAVGPLNPGDEVDLMVRPEGVRLVALETPGSLSGSVLSRRYAGEATFYRVRLDEAGEVVVAAGPEDARPGDRVAVAPRVGGLLPRAFPRSAGAA
ncbi:MAG: ABC transporter ATP-binding protein [Thermoanaerobaculia bacterium]|nr:ABC transporter ATP-binding protein [Thermoanaerobaculia bacterium]